MSGAERDLFEHMARSIRERNQDEAIRLAEVCLREAIDPTRAVDEGYARGIRDLGVLWDEGDVFLPELMMGAEAMKAAMKVLEPALLAGGGQLAAAGKVVIGTVQGDIHDIGKTLVGSILQASQFEVIDLGADVSAERFVEVAEAECAGIIGASALLTTTMLQQKKIAELLERRGLRDTVKLMVGGAPVSEEWAREIGADGYGSNAVEAVAEAQRLLGSG
jgi:corrinoid protein of di/trimethylamine methyltransferase